MNKARRVGCNPPAAENGSLTRWVAIHPTVSRLATALACCLLPAINSFADATHVEKDDGLTIIRMEVTPADESVPAFKHRLMFDAHERLPGNRPQWYMRAYPEEMTAWRKWREAVSNEDETGFEAYYESGTPIGEINWKRFELEQQITRSFMDDHIVPGAQRSDCDWGIRLDSFTGPEFVSFTLPEFQSTRAFARMASLQVRAAVSESRFDDAIRYLRATYQLGNDAAQEPILVCGLIGIAVTGMADAVTADLIAAPGSPNLYWSLAELSSRPIALRDAAGLELAIAPRMFPVLDKPENANHTPQEWNQIWQRVGCFHDYDTLYDQIQGKETSLFHEVMPLVSGLSGYSHAKQRMVHWGIDQQKVEEMAVGKVLTVYSARVYQLFSDRYRQAANVPFRAQAAYFQSGDRFQHENRPFSDGPDREIAPFASLWLPAMEAASRAEVRAKRDLAALRVIEALRMHAARNEGKWPRTLADVTCVPVPDNPATDKPFLYHLENGKTAVLDLPDWEGFPGYSRRYEVTIKP